MLAQNFLTAEALGITEAEVDAHIKVLGMLERGELEYEPDSFYPRIRNGFNMKTVQLNGECGTVGCIGGWVLHLMGRLSTGAGSLKNGCKTEAQRALYFAPNCKLDSITPAQAASALRNYLTLGEPRWAEVLA